MPASGIAQADDGGVHMAILLSQPQFLQIVTAAACLYPPDRDPFIAAVAAELHGLPIGDGTVGRAIRAVQGRFHHPEPEGPPARWARQTPRYERTPRRSV
jgi:hypothetical protein